MSGLMSCEETLYIYTKIQTHSVLYLVTRIEILKNPRGSRVHRFQHPVYMYA